MNNLRYIRWGNVFWFIIIPLVFILFCYFFVRVILMVHEYDQNYINRTETYHLTAKVVKVKYNEVYEVNSRRNNYIYYPVLIQDDNGISYNYVFRIDSNNKWNPSIGTEVYKDCWTEVDGKKFCDSEWDDTFEYSDTKR